ncbi:MAG: DegT/DnrJ/EryC1/StrS family aminotransferase [Vampirovibrionales bacterium]
MSQASVMATHSKLALHGGTPVRKHPFPAYTTLGAEEKHAVSRVMERGILSQFLGCDHPDFYGGPEVQAFERAWEHWFKMPHAISMNSATSALIAAVGALGIEPGDEVIVCPYTMCASASVVLWYSAIPVFADVEAEHFCLSIEAIEACITPRTRGIIIVDIFGQPHDAQALKKVATRHGLWVIEDTAQAPGAWYQEAYAGTLGDIGIYSLNYHKHIHTGEGGMAVTRSDDLAERLRLIRNHAEAVVGTRFPNAPPSQFANMIGQNYRMTELEAAIGQAQLSKLEPLLQARQAQVAALESHLKELPCFKLSPVRDGCTHAYYLHPIQFMADTFDTPVHRDDFLKALQAELFPEVWQGRTLSAQERLQLGRFSVGYVRPLYWEPLYQHRIAIGSQGHPWTTFHSNVTYPKGLCPTVEQLHQETLFCHDLIRPTMSKQDLSDVANACFKVYECLSRPSNAQKSLLNT